MSCSESASVTSGGGAGDTHTNLFPRLALKHGILGDPGHNKQLQILIPHSHVDKMLHLRKALAIEPRLLAHLSDGTHQIILVLVDLASRKTPARALLPPLHEQALVHGDIQDDGAAHGDPRLVRHKVEERALGAVGRESGDQRERTYGKNLGEEGAEIEGWQARVDLADKILKVPLRGLDLERQALRGTVSVESHHRCGGRGG